MSPAVATIYHRNPMTRAQEAADRVSTYLLTGMHHTTPEGQTAIAAIIGATLVEQTDAAEYSFFWRDRLGIGDVYGKIGAEYPNTPSHE